MSTGAVGEESPTVSGDRRLMLKLNCGAKLENADSRRDSSSSTLFLSSRRAGRQPASPQAPAARPHLHRAALRSLSHAFLRRCAMAWLGDECCGAADCSRTRRRAASAIRDRDVAFADDANSAAAHLPGHRKHMRLAWRHFRGIPWHCEVSMWISRARLCALNSCRPAICPASLERELPLDSTENGTWATAWIAPMRSAGAVPAIRRSRADSPSVLVQSVAPDCATTQHEGVRRTLALLTREAGSATGSPSSERTQCGRLRGVRCCTSSGCGRSSIFFPQSLFIMPTL